MNEEIKEAKDPKFKAFVVNKTGHSEDLNLGSSDLKVVFGRVRKWLVSASLSEIDHVYLVEKAKVKGLERLDTVMIIRMERTEQHRLALRYKVRMFYDLQRLKLQMEGRLYKRPNGGVIDLFQEDINALTDRAAELDKATANALKDVHEHLKVIPFYRDVLSDKERYKGIGPTMAGVILSEFDIHKCTTVSKAWAFAGIKPIPCKRCKACHVVCEEKNGVWKHIQKKAVKSFVHSSIEDEQDDDAIESEEEIVEAKVKCPKTDSLTEHDLYESARSQRPTKGQTLEYNSWLRAKLVGVLGEVLIKSGSPFRVFYDNYKHRKLHAGWGISKMHRHAAARRYMIRMLLLDIITKWRKYEGLEVRPSYQEQYLGHTHVEDILAMAEQEAARNNLSLKELVHESEVNAEMELL